MRYANHNAFVAVGATRGQWRVPLPVGSEIAAWHLHGVDQKDDFAQVESPKAWQ